MTKGHLHQELQHLQSTKQPDINIYMKNIYRKVARLKIKMSKNVNFRDPLEKGIKEDAFPSSLSPNVKTNDVIYLLLESSSAGMGYIDLTGRFPFCSAKGNQCILGAYHFDANSIYTKPIKIESQHSSLQRGRLLTKNLNTQNSIQHLDHI